MLDKKTHAYLRGATEISCRRAGSQLHAQNLLKADNHRLDSVRLTTESTRRHCGEKQEHQQYVVLRARGRGDSAYI